MGGPERSVVPAKHGAEGGRAAGAPSRPLLHLRPDLFQAVLRWGVRGGGEWRRSRGGRSTAGPVYLQEGLALLRLLKDVCPLRNVVCDGCHVVFLQMSSYTVPILLMKSSRSVCWPRGQEPGLFSLHQAGTVFLQPADRLFITVSNASTMEMDGRASYFGAFLVG